MNLKSLPFIILTLIPSIASAQSIDELGYSSRQMGLTRPERYQTQNVAPKTRKAAPKTTRKPIQKQMQEQYVVTPPPSLEIGKSAWYASLGIPEEGLYAGEDIRKNQFIGWYKGKIYTSPHRFKALSPSGFSENTYTVYHPFTSQYLYSIAAFQSEGDQFQICNAAFIKHKYPDLANAEFKLMEIEGAPGGYFPAVFAKWDIPKGAEITVSYGADADYELRQKSLSYRVQMVQNPKYNILDKKVSVQNLKLPLTRYFHIVPSFFTELSADLDELEGIRPSLSEVAEGIQPTSEVEQIADSWMTSIYNHLQALNETRAFELNEAGAEKLLRSLDELKATYLDFQVKLDNQVAKKEKDPIIAKLGYFVLKNRDLLTYISWRKSLILLGKEYRATSWEDKERLHQLRLVEVKNARTYLEQVSQLSHLSSSGTAIQNSLSLLEAPEASSPLSLLDEVKQHYFRGNNIIGEDSLPLKPDEDKIADRYTANDYYLQALYLSENAPAHVEMEWLKGSINWQLAINHYDKTLFDPEEALSFAKRALNHLRNASQDPRIREDLKSLILEVETFISEAQKVADELLNQGIESSTEQPKAPTRKYGLEPKAIIR